MRYAGYTVWLLLFINCALAANILIMAPTPSISHQLPFHIITKALLHRGHKVTLLTTDSTGIIHKNYTEIDISIGYKIFRNSFDYIQMVQESPFKTMWMIKHAPEGYLNIQLNETAVQALAKSGEKFDAAILERLAYQSQHGLWHALGSPPLIGFLTLTAPAPVYTALGNLFNPAYVPDVWLGFSDRMTFWQRLYNTVFYVALHWMWYYDAMPTQEAIMRRHFGSAPPSVYETENNYTLLIVNNHFCMEYARPQLPNIVELTGIHVNTKAKPLPQNIQKFMDDAEHGVIYFSLGSNVRSSTLPDEKRRAFIEAFRELPQRVIWKWESDNLTDQPDNLMISKWLPQQDILAHPKVRLFITQGGLQSLNEAAYHATPLVVIPFFSDQAHNAAKVAQAEFGVWLEFVDITKDTVLDSIRTILRDEKYRANMKRLSAVFREHKKVSVDNAVWWIEYVIRHHGAPHLRSAAVDMPWWQLLLLDVVGFVLLAVAMATTAAYLLLRAALRAFSRSTQKIKKQ